MPSCRQAQSRECAGRCAKSIILPSNSLLKKRSKPVGPFSGYRKCRTRCCRRSIVPGAPSLRFEAWAPRTMAAGTGLQAPLRLRGSPGHGGGRMNMGSRSVVPTLRQAQGRLLPHKTRKSGAASAVVSQRWPAPHVRKCRERRMFTNFLSSKTLGNVRSVPAFPPTGRPYAEKGWAIRSRPNLR